MGELAGEEAPCQFSTRWRVLGKRRMRDDGGVRDSKRVGWREVSVDSIREKKGGGGREGGA